MSKKEQLIKDIQLLLNSYDDENTTDINPNLLKFMDENTLVNIIDSLLKQKEDLLEYNTQWLEKFKKYDI
ncbi:hypothetical protein [Sulfurimonas sp.]|uniref:hypothetical protein n=1 Tax=Sulfurimonas sp. TaxID=2022749 RepID=UPI002AAF6424|nr:hypothetical protein [Sulfurimonas sp.]